MTDKPSIIVTINNDYNLLNIGLGQNLTIKLHENPMTGYKWHVVQNDDNLLNFIETSYQQDINNGEGGGGERRFLYETRKKGTVNWRAKNSRIWDSDSTDTREVTVVITIK